MRLTLRSSSTDVAGSFTRFAYKLNKHRTTWLIDMGSREARRATKEFEEDMRAALAPFIASCKDACRQSQPPRFGRAIILAKLSSLKDASKKT